ncbi:MAG: phosphoenolpyruvate carboxylase, partial [Hyphomicrobiales bacterium]|nr:phosphoenolpyruvate carboxylase [Hyphomicrobiales bacterium]
MMHYDAGAVAGLAPRLEQSATTSSANPSDLLFSLLLGVAARHCPDIAPVLRGETSDLSHLNPQSQARLFKTRNIWFQLLSVAEQFAEMRQRRETERERGDSVVKGTFANVIAEAARAKAPPQALRDLIANLRIRPVITAHPTEAKRVTVLEKLRRVYRLLVEFEQPRYTQRERAGVIDALRDEIELLWLTGELRLEKPAVEQEVYWGLHFFHETLFDGVPELLRKFDAAAHRFYPGEKFQVTPFFQFGSWIGGDRDGNPFVTNAVTRRALRDNALASMNYYREKLIGLLRTLSVTGEALAPPPAFQEALTQDLEMSGDGAGIAQRNPGEPYRQFAACMLIKLDATIARASRGTPGGYPGASELIADLRMLEDALAASGCAGLAARHVRPLRWAAETFRFSTVRLDLRENTTRTTDTLRALWKQENGEAEPPELDSPRWRSWLEAGLARPRDPERSFENLPDAARETLATFALVAEMRENLDREAFGAFVLSMTRSVPDILGAYLLAKEAGVFLDAAGTEICALPIVPLFETID